MTCFSSSSSSLPCFNALIFKPSLKRNSHQLSFLQVKAQCFRDEGRLNKSVVDANLSMLRERIEEVKMKERLERCCRSCDHQHGWNYSSVYHDPKIKKHNQFGEFLQLLGLVGGTIGITCLSGTLLLCLLSFFVHINQ